MVIWFLRVPSLAVTFREHVYVIIVHLTFEMTDLELAQKEVPKEYASGVRLMLLPLQDSVCVQHNCCPQKFIAWRIHHRTERPEDLVKTGPEQILIQATLG
jgi:hypothetical protein